MSDRLMTRLNKNNSGILLLCLVSEPWLCNTRVSYPKHFTVNFFQSCYKHQSMFTLHICFFTAHQTHCSECNSAAPSPLRRLPVSRRPDWWGVLLQAEGRDQDEGTRLCFLWNVRNPISYYLQMSKIVQRVSCSFIRQSVSNDVKWSLSDPLYFWWRLLGKAGQKVIWQWVVQWRQREKLILVDIKQNVFFFSSFLELYQQPPDKNHEESCFWMLQEESLATD